MVTSDSAKIQVANSHPSAVDTDHPQRSVNMNDINDMEKKVAQLRELNACIRAAATSGAVEEMIGLIESRRAFLDSLSIALDGQSVPLIAALHEAVLDNADLLTGLESVMDMARKRGKINFEARRRYRKTQTTS
jgi:hypothetical protein